jgi:CBS domain-containing protein
MLAPSVVALYGRSLILESVGRMLEGREGVEVVTVEEGPSLEAALDALAPAILIVDLHQVAVASALPVVDARPELLLVGLDPSGARLLVLSGRDARSVTTDELLRLIERRLPLAADATPSDSGAVPAGPPLP